MIPNTYRATTSLSAVELGTAIYEQLERQLLEGVVKDDDWLEAIKYFLNKGVIHHVEAPFYSPSKLQRRAILAARLKLPHVRREARLAHLERKRRRKKSGR